MQKAEFASNRLEIASKLLFIVIAAAYLLPGGIGNAALYAALAAGLLLAHPAEVLASGRQLAQGQPALALLFVLVIGNCLLRMQDASAAPAMAAAIGSVLLIAALFHLARLSRDVPMERIAMFIAVVSTAAVAINLLIYLISSGTDRFSFLLGKGRHPNQASALIGVGVLSIMRVLAAQRLSGDGWRLAGWLGAVVLHLAALGLAVSRGPVIALTPIAAAFAFFIIVPRKSYAVPFVAAVVCASAASVAAVLFADQIAASLCRDDLGFCRGAGRADIWGWVIERIAEHPLFGSGPAFRFEPEAKGHAHNAFMGLAMHFGLPAAALFVAGLALSLRGLLRRPVDIESAWLASILGFGVGCMFTDLIHPLAFFGAHYLYLWTPLALASRGGGE